MTALSGQIYAASAMMTPVDKSTLNFTSSSTTSRWRFNRSTTNLPEPESRPVEIVSRVREPEARSLSVVSRDTSSTPVPKLERASSRMSLFNLFSRPKAEKARGHKEVGLAVPMRPQTPQPTPPVSIPKSSLSSLGEDPSPPAPHTIRARSSQRFRPMSMRPVPPPREFGSWDPPPLFQAFPQSLKHATVQACVFTPEALMRTQSQRRQAELMRERMDTARDLPTITETGGAETKKLGKTHKRLMSNSVLIPPTPELVNKIYILVTAGFVLQYAGDGPFDRLPEKVLKLGRESAAFACDLISGKHWVLQISSHAHDDGTFETGPKNSLLSRLRSQNATLRKTATSFLLVLESAEEMDAWMSIVRKEIDNLGGVREMDDYERASSSIDESWEKKSLETTSHRYRVTRDQNVVNNVVSMDSARPKIVTSDWETSQSEQTASSADSSVQFGRWGNSRPSAEMSSVASTPVSQHQIQLDQLRGRSSFSFVSTATSASGAGTRNTSRESSPAPQSPLKEAFSSSGENEPFRSAMSLRSFQMNPSNSMSSCRRSMQPLPITNEDLSQAAETPIKKQRHSLYGSSSPNLPESGNPHTTGPVVPSGDSITPNIVKAAVTNTVHVMHAARSSPPQVTAEFHKSSAVVVPVSAREDSPVRFNNMNYNAPARRDVLPPPPKGTATLPPRPAQRQSIAGTFPDLSTNTASLLTSANVDMRARRRASASPKPFMRPLPVRPQAQHGDSSKVVARRQSSLTPISAPTPLLFGVNVNRSVTAPVGPPSVASNSSPRNSINSTQSSQTLRRPASVQIRTADPAPFLSSVRTISSTPSFVPGRRMFSAPGLAPAPSVRAPQATPSINILRQQALAQQTERKALMLKRSMPSIRLPPPAPPPNMPLPPPPPAMAIPAPPQTNTAPSPPPSIPLPAPPPKIHLPAPPPNMPLPPTPPQVASRATAV
ncbi:hypothetical protein EJ02DRAFT_240900 [Clathrospora elynae]|uniref:PH domain-containing protein n=1 Tax=Clathrospora elynae TaxID=706981 RepID=A0A6A5SH82_9PLEO|nr:hypothetical protein EJ02DRAFT_240900 [Clathrospora elynae]